MVLVPVLLLVLMQVHGDGDYAGWLARLAELWIAFELNSKNPQNFEIPNFPKILQIPPIPKIPQIPKI